MSASPAAILNPPEGAPAPRRPGVRKARNSLFAQGEPMVWLTGGALAIALSMIVGLLVFVAIMGFSTFWPGEVVQLTARDGSVYLGEIDREEWRELEGGELVRRQLIRTERTSDHFEWIDDADVIKVERPPSALVIERRTGGRMYGSPTALYVDGAKEADTPQEALKSLKKHLPATRERTAQRKVLETYALGKLNRREEDARLALRKVELRKPGSEDDAAWQAEHARAVAHLREVETSGRRRAADISLEIKSLADANARYELAVATTTGEERAPLADIVRAYPANRLTFGGKLAVYISRWREFLFDDPREANSEGGVFPAIVGTVIMTLFMSLAVAPFGVSAALYLREYAKAGPLVSAVRISINNLAGVPSVVFGVFGLGFFCYLVGGELIDPNFFPERLPNPTFGKGALIWASLTLALLTLPVVIVATEEALAAVPNSVREGSYACGASKWQTLRRIVLPRAMPGIMTGMILAMARGAGEVAPLMLVGAVKMAPDLPIDGVFPYLHPDRSFMHLGFHIFDLGFQSQNSNAAKPMVFTTALLLISVIAFLNITAILVRGRLRQRYSSNQF